MKHVGGKDWQEWYPLARNGLLNPKHKRGQACNWPEPMCRDFNTALAILTLQMPDSRLPSAKR
jgi:hypothetical protein